MSNALSRKCAYYLSLIWHGGVDNLDRQQKETVLLMAISVVTMLFSSITIISEKSSRKRYQPQGGITRFGFATKTDSPSSKSELSNVSSLGRSKVHQTGAPLTKQEEQLLQQLLNKQRTAREAEMFGVK